MKPELERAFTDVANQFAVPDKIRKGEWKCRLCGGQTVVDGPIIHTTECALHVLYDALAADEAQS